jgi:hypothetical protein
MMRKFKSFNDLEIKSIELILSYYEKNGNHPCIQTLLAENNIFSKKEKGKFVLSKIDRFDRSDKANKTSLLKIISYITSFYILIKFLHLNEYICYSAKVATPWIENKYPFLGNEFRLHGYNSDLLLHDDVFNYLDSCFSYGIVPLFKLYQLKDNIFTPNEELEYQEQLAREYDYHREQLDQQHRLHMDQLIESKDQFGASLKKLKHQLIATWVIAIFGIIATLASTGFYIATYFWPTDKVVSNEKTNKELVNAIQQIPKPEAKSTIIINP